MEFQSGVLLCRIVEKVEYMRGIPGVCKKKKNEPSWSKANALHNISKALAILQQKKVRPTVVRFGNAALSLGFLTTA